MAKKKGPVKVVTLRCTVDGRSCHTTRKNSKNTPARMELMKYSKFLRKYTLHKEDKK